MRPRRKARRLRGRQKPRLRLVDLPVTLTKDELAAVMDRSPRWIEALASKGQLPIPRIANAPGLLFDRDDVNAWKAQKTFAPTGATT